MNYFQKYLGYLAVAIMAAINFGIWQHSFVAGCFVVTAAVVAWMWKD